MSNVAAKADKSMQKSAHEVIESPQFKALVAKRWSVSMALLVLLTLSGLAAIIAMARSGVRIFWGATASPPRVRLIEMAPVALLLALCLALTVLAGPAMDYLNATAQALHAPGGYIESVLTP